jgi:hypothetical protein
MRASIALLAAVVPLAAAGPAAATAAVSVEIKDAVAQVTVVPEDRPDVLVVVLSRQARLPLTIRPGRRTIVDGGLKASRIRDCTGEGDRVVVRIKGLGDVRAAEIPRLVIHTPRDVEVAAGGAVFGAIGRSGSVTLGNAGCGDWAIGNVERELKVSLAGTGDARAGAAASARLRVAGDGGISTGDIRGPVVVDLAGSGDVRVRSVAGPLEVRMAGSGDVAVAGGHATAMTARVAGSGSIVFNGVADSLQAQIAGSGDVRVRQVTGPVRRSVIGQGSIVVGAKSPGVLGPSRP